jgi:2-polyprenyl-6-hydroxyphenyl methylase/3-demethylubiquinone-9 3-methyltransferase
LDLKDLSSHFHFGENWKSYASMVDEHRIAGAVAGLQQLVPADQMAGKRFLDIGCGSGLHMLAALRLGAASVTGFDIDPNSVAASQSLLQRFAPNQPWTAEVTSVFTMAAERQGTFDVVYSWGVLHHTGDMWKAIDRAATLVAPGGLLVLALYHKTPLCGFWRAEKKVYAHAPGWVQRLLRGVYKGAYFLRQVCAGQNPWRSIKEYGCRGMDWHHDVHDWMGGYPYESVLPPEVVDFLAQRGFEMEQVLEHCAGTRGLFGTGCDEFVARRR